MTGVKPSSESELRRDRIVVAARCPGTPQLANQATPAFVYHGKGIDDAVGRLQAALGRPYFLCDEGQ